MTGIPELLLKSQRRWRTWYISSCRNMGKLIRIPCLSIDHRQHLAMTGLYPITALPIRSVEDMIDSSFVALWYVAGSELHTYHMNIDCRTSKSHTDIIASVLEPSLVQYLRLRLWDNSRFAFTGAHRRRIHFSRTKQS